MGKKRMDELFEFELFSEMNYFGVFIRLPLSSSWSVTLSPPNLPSPYYLLSPSSLVPLIMGCVQSSVVDEEARARASPF